VTYGEGLGLFDHLQKAIVLDFNDSPQMRTTFEALVNEYRKTGAASHAMMTALMNQCLILVLRRVSDEAQGSLPWLSALEDPQLAGVIDAMLQHPEQHHTRRVPGNPRPHESIGVRASVRRVLQPTSHGLPTRRPAPTRSAASMPRRSLRR